MSTVAPAAEYIVNVLSWTNENINNPVSFQEDQDEQFPKEVRQIGSKIFPRLFRVYAHLHHHHEADMRAERVVTLRISIFEGIQIDTGRSNHPPTTIP
jgi:hypothetical protein